ncbi:type III pantothenate kinase [Adhaeribacter aquaticus]|uniref:type III pantothenate kinase n=1 Tax=Adhaeribacter aquaticus TaxID=299567 RepID=UPI00041D52B5|nr:type III pantothenate kinase [Adhaeribacter aquaticus]
MYNLALDFGNTAIKYGFFEAESLRKSGTIGQEQELALLPEITQIDNVIISSVRENIGKLSALSEVKGITITLNYQTPIPVKNGYETPQTLGMDRLAAVIGAKALYPDKDCLVIDAGTCITYDFVDNQHYYHGGSIAPGLEMKFKAVHTFTQKLPLVEQTSGPVKLTGRNTREAIQSGILNGTLAEVQGIINVYKEQAPKLVVVLCGGDAAFFETNLKQHIFVVPELVLIGLNRILNYNV